MWSAPGYVSLFPFNLAGNIDNRSDDSFLSVRARNLTILRSETRRVRFHSMIQIAANFVTGADEQSQNVFFQIASFREREGSVYRIKIQTGPNRKDRETPN